MTLKNSYLVAKRRKIRVARNPKDMSTFVTLLYMYIFHACIFVYIVSYILVCYLCILLERNLIRTYIWTYVSSVEFIYENLIETKKN